MSSYKVLVVDDSAFMRKIVSDLIQEDPRYTVIGTARNGQEAIQKVSELRPDAVTMDVEMPVLNGLQALRAIMMERPTPVIMLSSLTEEGARETIEALELGAVDFVQKPSGPISLDIHKVGALLREKLGAAVLSRPKRSVMPEPISALQQSANVSCDRLPPPGLLQHLIAIGTSTGGPRALQQVISSLPGTLPAAVLVVQHMPPGFTKLLADRLNGLAALTVVEAEQGRLIEPGHVYIAPGGWHMEAAESGKSEFRIRLTQDAPRNGHRPSVDLLFESLVPLSSLSRSVVLMTGMGSDGARGMRMLYDAGVRATVAESEQSCIVYGMPRAAIELECANYVLPLEKIAAMLVQFASSPAAGNP